MHWASFAHLKLRIRQGPAESAAVNFKPESTQRRSGKASLATPNCSLTCPSLFEIGVGRRLA